MEDARLSRVGVPNHKELEEEICSQSVAHVSTANKSKAKGEATAYMCVCVSVCVCECVRPNVLSTLSWQHQPAEKGKHNQKPYTQEPSLTHRMFRSWLCCCFVALLRVCLLANGKCVFFPFLLPSLSLSQARSFSHSSLLFSSLCQFSLNPIRITTAELLGWLTLLVCGLSCVCLFFCLLPFAFGGFLSQVRTRRRAVCGGYTALPECMPRVAGSSCSRFKPFAFCRASCTVLSFQSTTCAMRPPFFGALEEKKKSAKKKAKQKRKRKKSKSVWWHAISRTHNLTLVSILFPLAFGFCCLLLFPPPSDLCVCVCVCVCVSGAPTLFCFLLPLLASCWMRDSLSN